MVAGKDTAPGWALVELAASEAMVAERAMRGGVA